MTKEKLKRRKSGRIYQPGNKYAKAHRAAEESYIIPGPSSAGASTRLENRPGAPKLHHGQYLQEEGVHLGKRIYNQFAKVLIRHK